MRRHPCIAPIATFVAIASLNACGDRVQDSIPDSSATFRLVVDSAVPIWSVSPDPTLEIGVVHGDSNYELDRAFSSLRLGDGTIVVSNAGSNELRFFDNNGRFLKNVGGSGRGPGEFARLSRIYRHGTDSILASDRGPNSLTVFDTAGNFGRRGPASLISGDTVFPLDTWLFEQFWVEGALELSLRSAVKRVLEPLQVSGTELPYRFVQVSDKGDLWIREPLINKDAQSWHWTVFDSTGRSTALVETPLGFYIHEIGNDYLLGGWQDTDGVNFIRLYALRASDATGRVPGWITSTSDTLPTLSPDEAERLLKEMRTALKYLVLAQESFYVDHMTYTENRYLLDWTQPEDVMLDIITAEREGWAAVATHRRLGKICGMALGSGTPPGWLEGGARCG
jgi:hypothetical protein